MRRTATPVLAGFGALASLMAVGGTALSARAETPTTAQTCRKAEVNPVTGYAFCFDPIGAPVEPPPDAAEIPCKTDSHEGEAWTWGPKCKS